MLSQQRRWLSDGAGRFRELDGNVDELDLARHRVLALDDHSTSFDLRVLNDLIDGVDRPYRDAMREQQFLPLLVGPGQEYLFEPSDELSPILNSSGVGGEAGIVHHRFKAHDGAEDAPEAVTAHRQGQVFGLGPKRLVG